MELTNRTAKAVFGDPAPSPPEVGQTPAGGYEPDKQFLDIKKPDNFLMSELLKRQGGSTRQIKKIRSGTSLIT